MTEPSIYAVLGKPILHSLSPATFNAAFRERKIPAIYTRLTAMTARMALQSTREIGIAGLNVTAPFKEETAALADSLDESASSLGALNALVLSDGKANGYNTDPQGVAGALSAAGFAVAGKNVVIVGAGGAARAAATALRSMNAERITIANRTLLRARQVAALVGGEAIGLNDLPARLAEAQLLVSCLPVGAQIPVIQLPQSVTVLDADYTGGVFRSLAERDGCRIIEGSSWLLHQALASYRLFTGSEPPSVTMCNALAAKTDPKQTIALIGFMGSGKSSVGVALAEALNKEFVDLDQAIEEEAGRTIAQIFAEENEAGFRRREKAMLLGLDGQKMPLVACGGGVVEDEDNIRLLHEKATVIWLWASAATCFARTTGDKRPLRQADDLPAFANLLHRRIAKYARVADLTVVTEEESIDTIVRLIVDEVHQTKRD